MKIYEVLSEAPMTGTLGTMASMGGAAGASMGQAMKSAALGALGLKNTQNQYQQKNQIGAYADPSSQNAAELVKQLGIKQGMDFQVAPNQKVKITRVDAKGATFVDPKTNLPVVLGPEALAGIAQRQQALQTVAQMGKQPAVQAQPKV